MLFSVLVHRLKYALFLIFFVCNKGILCDPNSNQNKYSKASSASDYVDKSILEETETILLEGCHEDMACLIRASDDRAGLDAIRALHKQLDDDDNGAVDLSESHDFLRGELKYEKDAERRQKAFHRNDDMHISVKELWEAWVKSEVHNWTVEQTADWLSSNVELPQYVPLFIVKRVTGTHLPRLASSNGQYITNVLGIKDPIHRQKIMLKAMDVVLFGPPKENASYAKDLILTSLLVLATIGCYYAYRQYRTSKNHLQRMMSDMESLQKAELNYQNLQKELERAKQEQEYATTEKQNLEKRLKEQSVDGSDLHNSNYSMEVTQLKEEVELLRNALQRAEGELVDRYWSPPPGLQLWLQLTHEIENKAYSAKKVAAEKQLQAARDACEKLRRKRSSLVGAFVSTHGKSIDDVDRSIVDARTALNEVTQELAERVHRWKQIESLCGFTITNNKGLAALENVLYKNSINGRNLGFRGRMSSQDNLDDETSSNYSVPTGISYTDRPAFENFNSWTEGQETSDSDKLEPEDEEDSLRSNVQFIVGASEPDDHSRKNHVHVAANSALKDRESHVSVKNYSRLVKPVAEEHNGVSPESENSKKPHPLLASVEHSTSAEHIQKVRRPPRKSELAHSASVSTTSTMDDEACSTDSNSNSAPIDDAVPREPKKTKTKLKMFPRFGRKISKNSSTTHVHSE